MVDLSNALVHNVRHTNRIDIVAVNYAILVSIVFFALVYLFSINSLGTQGYNIRNLETKIKQLESRHKYLELEVSNLQSLSTIREAAGIANYVPAGSATYMKDSDFALK